MYAWKWWRDCRGRVLLYLVAALIFGLSATAEASWAVSWIGRFANNPGRANFYVNLAWLSLRYDLWSPTWMGATWIALALAISSFGRDYAGAGKHYLLTRPVNRAVMLWTDWAFAIGTVSLCGIVLTGTAILSMRYWIPQIANWSVLVNVPAGIAIAMAVYGIVLFCTAATGSPTRGIEAATAVLLLVWLAPGALLDWWHMTWADNAQNWMMRIFEWKPVHQVWFRNYKDSIMMRTQEPYPYVVLATWLLIGLILVYGTQKIIERREA